MQRRAGVSSLEFWNKILFISFLSGSGGLAYLIFEIFSKPLHKNLICPLNTIYNTCPRALGVCFDPGVF